MQQINQSETPANFPEGLLLAWRRQAIAAVLQGEDPELALTNAQRKAEAYMSCINARDIITLTYVEINNVNDSCGEQAEQSEKREEDKMDDNLQLMSSLESIAVFLAAFPALWISGRIILRNYTGDDRSTQIFLWLALGGLIFTPLVDFLRYLSSILSLIIPSLRNSGPNIVLLGAGPYLLYSTILLSLGIIVYGLAIYDARTLFAQDKIPLIQGLQLGNWELGFVLFGIAGLINQMVRGIVVRFVSIYLPNLTAQQDLVQGLRGFWISWLIAFLILLVTAFLMNERIYRREEANSL